MKNKVNWEDFIIGIIVTAIGVFLFFSSLSLGSGNELTRGADFMPKIISALLALLGVIFIINSFARKDKSVSQALSKTELRRFLIAAGIFFVYIFFLRQIGYLIMTALYILAQSWFVTPSTKRKPIKLAVIAVSVSVITYFVFVYGFKLILPAGVLG